jgi:hypothetical protein
MARKCQFPNCQEEGQKRTVPWSKKPKWYCVGHWADCLFVYLESQPHARHRALWQRKEG